MEDGYLRVAMGQQWRIGNSLNAEQTILNPAGSCAMFVYIAWRPERRQAWSPGNRISILAPPGPPTLNQRAAEQVNLRMNALARRAAGLLFSTLCLH